MISALGCIAFVDGKILASSKGMDPAIDRWVGGSGIISKGHSNQFDG